METDEQEFARKADASLEALKASLYRIEESADIDVEMNSGALKLNFEDPPGTFVISPNAAVKQIWISALSTSFKLDWSDERKDFILPKTAEPLKLLVARLINQHLNSDQIHLS